MTEYWLDANFFIPAEKFHHYLTTFNDVIAFIGRKKKEYSLKITKRVSNEVKRFSNLIHIYFKTVTIENSQEFRDYCKETRFAIGYSKEKKEPADNSLAFAALTSENDAFIVTNDEGFLKIKRKKPNLLKNVEIIEPTDFLKKIMLEVEDDDFKERIRFLIIHYSEHFITFRLKNQRSITRILESLLVVGTITTLVPISTKIGTPQKGLPKRDMNALERFISNQTLTDQEKNRLKPIASVFEPFADYYKSVGINPQNAHNNLTGFLYLKFPELLLNLRQLALMEKKDGEKEILNYTYTLERFMLKKMFSIRIKETIQYYNECDFKKAFLHFKPLLESDWQSLKLSSEKKSVLKFLYGIFLLNVEDLEFLEYLITNDFWEEFKNIDQIFKILFNIVKGIDSEIQNLTDSRIQLFYNLGLYYANSGSPFGFNIFNAIFQLDRRGLENLEWYKDFLKRYLLEIRINQKEISEAMKIKFLKFFPTSLDDNTNSTFDRNYELKEFTPIDDTPTFYRQVLYFITMKELDHFIEAYCWNDMIRSIVLLQIPRKLCPRLKNVKTLQIKSGNIKTKKILPMDKKKKKARIIIELDENFHLDLERFQMKISKFT